MLKSSLSLSLSLLLYLTAALPRQVYPGHTFLGFRQLRFHLAPTSLAPPHLDTNEERFRMVSYSYNSQAFGGRIGVVMPLSDKPAGGKCSIHLNQTWSWLMQEGRINPS